MYGMLLPHSLLVTMTIFSGGCRLLATNNDPAMNRDPVKHHQVGTLYLCTFDIDWFKT